MVIQIPTISVVLNFETQLRNATYLPTIITNNLHINVSNSSESIVFNQTTPTWI